MADNNAANSSTGWNTEIFWAVSALMLLVLAWIFWSNFRQVVVYPAFALNWAYLWIMAEAQLLDASGYKVLGYIELLLAGKVQIAEAVSWNLFAEIRNFVGQQTRYFNVLVVLVCLLVLKLHGIDDSFTRRFTVKLGRDKRHKLHEYQVKLFPIATVSAFFEADGYDKDITRALTPIEWLLSNQIGYEKGVLDSEALFDALKKQIGDYWTCLENTDYLFQAVAILCALDIINHEKAYEEKEKIAFAWCGRKNGERKTRNLIRRYINNPEVREAIDYVAEDYAFEKTVLLGLMNKSAEVGSAVFSSEFLWLRRLDRQLWYTVSNFDRPFPLIEGLAASRHFEAERRIGKKQDLFRIDRMRGGLLKYLKNSEIWSFSEYLRVANLRKKETTIEMLARKGRHFPEERLK